MTDGREIEPPFTNTRLEAEENQALMALARAGADAFGYTATLHLDRELAQLVRLRVAQINNCAYCLNVHHQAAADVPVDPVKVRLLSAWWETTLFDEAERAALAYAERLTRAADATSDTAFQDVHDELVSHFDSASVVELVGVIINMNIWTRLKLAEGATPA
jgi:AhpD family alkylhydroperoxidase